MGKVIKDLIEYNGISTCLNVSSNNFRQINTDYTFCIPDLSIKIDQIFRVWVNACNLDTKLIKTPVGTSLEGQQLTGYKALISGDLNIKLEYVACDCIGSVHTLRTKVPFCGYVVLPEDVNPNVMIDSRVLIEDILVEEISCGCIYVNTTMMLVAEVC